MNSFLNQNRPPVFCPGCSHERVTHALDQAFQKAELAPEDILIVTDIGCSGLFDTFFNTHAFHGVHGRALTYATGIKMAQPHLNVVVVMGDGGLGIGGAHVLSTCRRNIDLTLLVLNNFNYGMTGGQCSATTPPGAQVSSGFLNQLELPLDICQVAAAAGAGMVTRASTYAATLVDRLLEAIRFDGFSLVDIHGICPGRYTRRNKLTPKAIEENLAQLPSVASLTAGNSRMEYGQAYRQAAAKLEPVAHPIRIEQVCQPPSGTERREVVMLGSAGQRIITAGEILCLAGATAGLHTTQKNDYPITVMRGHSVSEMILSDCSIGYTGIRNPAVVIALAQEGVNRRKALFEKLAGECVVIKAAGLQLPVTHALIKEADFKAWRIKPQDWGIAALALLAQEKCVLERTMLQAALALRFKGEVLEKVQQVVGLVFDMPVAGA